MPERLAFKSNPPAELIKCFKDLFSLYLTVVGYNNIPLNLTVSCFLGIINTSPCSINKSDFDPGDAKISSKLIPIDSDSSKEI